MPGTERSGWERLRTAGPRRRAEQLYQQLDMLVSRMDSITSLPVESRTATAIVALLLDNMRTVAAAVL
jgi:ABC-type uncharacterized transport system ATPase subunit